MMKWNKTFVIVLAAVMVLCSYSAMIAQSPAVFYMDPDATTAGTAGTQSDPWHSLNWTTINSNLATGSDVIVYLSASNAAHTADQTGSPISIATNTTSGNYTSYGHLTLDGKTYYNNNDSAPGPSTWLTNFTPPSTLCVIDSPGCTWTSSVFLFHIASASSPITSNNDQGTGCKNGVTISGFRTVQGPSSGSQAMDFVYISNAVVEYSDISSASGTGAGPGLIYGPGNHGPGTNCGVTTVPNITVQMNWVHHTYGECMYVGASSSDPVTTPFSTPTGDNYLIQYNRNEDCGAWGGQGEGIDVKDGHTNLRVNHNIFRPNLHGLAAVTDGQGIDFESASLIDGNYVELPGHNGIAVASGWCNSSGRGTVDVRNNILVNTNGPTGHRYPMQVFDTTCDNTHNWQGARFFNNSAFSSSDTCIDIASGNNNGMATAENNICSGTAAVGGTTITGGAKFALVDYNDRFNAGTCTPGVTETHGKCSDPLFVSTSMPYAPENFKLQGTSTLLTAGVDLTAIFTDDFFGGARVAPFSIGAYQLTGNAVFGSPNISCHFAPAVSATKTAVGGTVKVCKAVI